MTMYKAAKYYIDNYNWVLVEIPPATKNPTKTGWNIRENCITTVDQCKFYKDHPDWNMGLLLSESNVVSIDIDNVVNTKIAFNSLGIDYDKIINSAPRITGRPNHDKVLFKAPPGIVLARKALSWPTAEDQSKNAVVFELRAGPIQDVLPPSMHPDTKVPYGWVRDPDEGIPDLPKELLTIWREWDKFKVELLNVCPWSEKKELPPPKKTRLVAQTSEDVIGKFNSSNNIENLLTQYGYKRTAGGRYLSPYSTTGLAGVIVFPSENRIFSHHGSDPFDTSHSLDAFDLYCHFDHGGDVTSAVREASKELNISNVISYDPELINHGREVFESWTNKSEDNKSISIPENLLCVPGILQDVVEYYNTTAPKMQPQFAVQTALALGSVVMGRRWKTNQNNYTGLYFVCVGKSSSGKEHSKTVLEDLLLEAQLDFLIGPSGYTSSGGVLSALIERPCHISIIDELGKLMESSQRAGNSNQIDAQTTIMETFGRLHGILRAQGYSSMTLTQSQKENEGVKQVHRPSLSILAMTTPSTLYSSISSRYISSGFIPRLIIVETEIGRQLSRFVTEPPKSQRLIEWMKACATACEQSGNLVADFGPRNPPAPVVIPFDQRCWPLLKKYEQELLDNMNDGEQHGLDEMFGKSKEIAQRVALIVAVSCESKVILPEHVTWAINYVRFYNMQTIDKLKSIMSDSQFESTCKQVLEIIAKGGTKGATDREISKGSGLMRGLDPKQRNSVMTSLQNDHGIKLCKIEHTGAGRTRTAWICPDEYQD